MYQQSFSRTNPGCIVFLVDRSDSMSANWAGSTFSLAQGAARAINQVLLELCVKSIKEAGAPLRRYFDVGIYGYGLRPASGTEGFESILPGDLARRGIVPLPELADHPLTVREEPSIDAMAEPSRVPIWVEPVHGHRTPMCGAMAAAGAHVFQWAQQFANSFPPIIINITDGMVTDSPYEGADLAEWARRLTTISTVDGHALLLNVFLSPKRQPVISFPSGPEGLPVPGPLLFEISSELPQPMIDNARAAHLPVGPGARGLVFNADLSALVTFLEIGTRVDVRHG